MKMENNKKKKKKKRWSKDIFDNNDNIKYNDNIIFGK